MSTVPVKDIECIQFFEFHYPIWNSAPPATIGLTPLQLTALDIATKAARNTFTAQQNAKNAAKAATVNFRTAIGTLRNSGADLVKAIRAFAQTSNNPAVYSLAQIDPPAPPVPRPAPGQPNDFTVNLSTEGAIVLKWKATNAAASGGVYFNIRRKLSGDVPTIVMKNGQPWLAIGTPGGHTIGQTVPQMVLNAIDFGMDVQAAIAAPRVSFAEPNLLLVESAVPESVRTGLQARGHTIRVVAALGDAHGLTIEYDARGKPVRFRGGSDPRGEGVAKGY